MKIDKDDLILRVISLFAGLGIMCFIKAIIEWL